LAGLDLPREFPDVVALVAKILIGMLVYLAAALALWRLSGCPQGGETYLLTSLRRVLPGR
jgi:hypothetical protein